MTHGASVSVPSEIFIHDIRTRHKQGFYHPIYIPIRPPETPGRPSLHKNLHSFRAAIPYKFLTFPINFLYVIMSVKVTLFRHNSERGVFFFLEIMAVSIPRQDILPGAILLKVYNYTFVYPRIREYREGIMFDVVPGVGFDVFFFAAK